MHTLSFTSFKKKFLLGKASDISHFVCILILGRELSAWDDFPLFMLVADIQSQTLKKPFPSSLCAWFSECVTCGGRFGSWVQGVRRASPFPAAEPVFRVRSRVNNDCPQGTLGSGWQEEPPATGLGAGVSGGSWGGTTGPSRATN